MTYGLPGGFAVVVADVVPLIFNVERNTPLVPSRARNRERNRGRRGVAEGETGREKGGEEGEVTSVFVRFSKKYA